MTNTVIEWAFTGAVDLSSGSPTAVTLVSDLDNVTEIEIQINDWSTNTANQAPMIQIGDSGGLETSGYSGRGFGVTSSTVANTNSAGFICGPEGGFDAAGIAHLMIRLHHMGSNRWAYTVHGVTTTGPTTGGGSGDKVLTGVLDRISLTTSGGSATFDGGTAYIRSR